MRLGLACFLCVGCAGEAVSEMGGDPRDAGFVFEDPADLMDGEPDLAESLMNFGMDPCGNDPVDPACLDTKFSSPFPVGSDPIPDPAVQDTGLSRTTQGFLRLSATALKGTYVMLVPGCNDDMVDGAHVDTIWYRVHWGGDVFPDTAIRVRAQSSDATTVDDPWWPGAAWTRAATASPLDLQETLRPNLFPGDPAGTVVHDSMLRVELELSSQSPGKSPVLKHFDVAFKCHGP